MTLPPTGSLQEPELLLFEISSPGTVGMSLPGTEVPDAGSAGIEGHLLRKEIVDFPELSEVDVVRHFTRLSRWNYAIDLGLFPLGSCTMKYNPRFNENAARLPGLAGSHPAAASGDCQGSLALMFELEQMLCSITGMAAVTLQPPAGAAGELAGVMLTNPNTLGIFENRIEEICRTVHDGGGLVYMDGANMNALVGVHRPGDVGVDVMHLNLHKTFSTPHGGGGPGSGAVAVTAELEPFLPGPRVVRAGKSFDLDEERPRSIGRVATFHGQFGMMIRAYAYILSLGAPGLRRNTELAVVHANYLRKRLEGTYHLPYATPTLHEVVFSDSKLQEHGVSTMDLAKRLMDYDFHAPTIYFPLVVKGAIMIEPTETEGRRELDRFVDAMEAIAREARETPELVRKAPISMPVGRLDEAAAARRPVLRWRSKADS